MSRPREIPGSLVAAATAAGVIAQQVAAKAVRDALFLSTFGVRALPLVMTAGNVLSLAAVFAISGIMARYAPRRVLLVLFGLSGFAFALEWISMAVAPGAVGVAVYLHVTVLNPVILSAFWSLVNENFDPHTARRAVARIATGGTLGGILGGLGAWRASTLVSLPTAVLCLAGVNAVCLVGALAIPRRAPQSVSPASVPPPAKELWNFGLLAHAPYLRNLALLVGIGGVSSSLLDFVLSSQVAATYGKGTELLAFFSLFGLGVSVLSFLLQLSLGRLAMEKVGLAVNIAVLPGIVLLGGAVGLAVPGLASSVMLRGAELVQRNTLFRSAYELLYTPLQEQQKRAAKAIIDVGFDRIGSALGSALALGAVALFLHPQSLLLGAVLAMAAATLPLVRRLHLGYVDALKGRLREVEDALPVEAHATSVRNPRLEDPAGDALIETVERVRQHDDERGPAHDALGHARLLLEGASDLMSGDPARSRRALAGWDRSNLPLASFGILLLADEQVHVDARKALRTVANEITGQLLDALLDPTMDFVVRRRVPAVLAFCNTQRAADGLLLALADERFEVRYASVRSLMRVVERSDAIVFVEEAIIQVIAREIERATTVFNELDDGSNEEPNPRLELINDDRITRSVETLFSLLSLILEREGLRLCFKGLHHESDHQRGTALEYLQTVLPSELREQLLPLLSDAGPLPSVRTPAELLAELSQGT